MQWIELDFNWINFYYQSATIFLINKPTMLQMGMKIMQIATGATDQIFHWQNHAAKLEQR